MLVWTQIDTILENNQFKNRNVILYFDDGYVISKHIVRYSKFSLTIRQTKLLKNNEYIKFSISALESKYNIKFIIKNTRSDYFKIKTILFFNNKHSYKIYADYHSIRMKECCKQSNTISSFISNKSDYSINYSKTILIYNRENTRIIDKQNIDNFIHLGNKYGFNVKQITVNKFSPEEQFIICSQPYYMIISPHGAQLSSLINHNPNTIIIEILPDFFYSNYFNFIILQNNSKWIRLSNQICVCLNNKKNLDYSYPKKNDINKNKKYISLENNTINKILNYL